MQVPPPSPAPTLMSGAEVITAVEWHDTVASTNEVALVAAAAGQPGGLLIGTDAQTAGRGRRGRVWVAPPGTSLTVSLMLRPTLPPRTWPLLTLMAGTAVQAAVTGHCPGVDVGLKWPNDLLIEGHKAAGILVESAGDAVVIGVGLNLDWRGVQRPDGIVATSLAEVAGRAVDRAAVLAELVSALDRGYRAAMVDPSGIVRQYVPHCATLGRTVVAHGGVDDIRGNAVGLTLDGHLRIRTDTGTETVVSAGEVEHLR